MADKEGCAPGGRKRPTAALPVIDEAGDYYKFIDVRKSVEKRSRTLTSMSR